MTLRIGLFGLLAAGNSGNEASMETFLAYLRSAQPTAVIDAMSGGAERVRARHGIDARPISWYERFEGRGSRVTALPLRIFGKLVDPLRILSWVRRHDAIIVPGAGILEATLPMRAYGFPLSMFMLGVSGRISGVKVALVSVGADFIKKRVTRQLSNGTARLVSYRSYRDQYSMDVMRQRGIDTSADHVFPDLVFGVPTPPYEPGDPQLVGVGVMHYQGGNDDRARAGEIHEAYVSKMTKFVRWLLDNGYNVRLFGGDSRADHGVAERILASIEANGDAHASPRLSAASMSSYSEMLIEMNRVGTVVATRYHNVMCALKLSKPTISIGYSQKFAALMDGMGVGEFAQFAAELDVDLLVKQFMEVQRHREELVAEMTKRNAANAESLAGQFALLSEVLFS
jgi:polysaccharide pyruvyl transferase WcaK-like protein